MIITNHGPLVILLDADGVVIDFHTQAFNLIRELTGHQYTKNDLRTYDIFDTWPEVREAFLASCDRPGFCAELDLYPESMGGVSMLRELGAVVAVTAPMVTSKLWVYERTECLINQLGFTKHEIIFTFAKQLVEGDVLIEDMPDNLVRWKGRHPDALAILWDQPYNRSFDLPGYHRVHSWTEAVRLIRSRFDIDQPISLREAP